MDHSTLAAPVAKAIPHAHAFGDVRLDDPYAWLEDRDDPEVIAHLKAENAYTEAVLAGTAELRETLYQEFIGRVQRTDTRVPFRVGDFLYYIRTEAGRDYDILCRKRAAPDAAEEILLDLNTIAKEYLTLGYCTPTLDGRYLAYALNETGGLEYTLSIKDLESGEILPEQLPCAGYGFAWAADQRTLLHTQQDETLRPFAVYRHALGADPAADALLYREDDPIFSVSVTISGSKEYLLATSWSAESSEVRYLRADHPEGQFALFAPRRPGILYSLEHHGDGFLLLTNEDARNFRLLAVPVAETARANQRELVPHREDALLQDVDVFSHHVLVSGREGGLTRLWIHDLASGETQPLEFREAVHTVHVGDNREFDTTRAVVAYASFTTPPSFYEVDLETGERTLIKQEAVLGGYDPERYVSERIVATAPDGTGIPISLVRRRDAPAGPQPLLLRGYGSYGYSYEPRFARNELSLIDRGATYAVAHIRGGQELGRWWYEDGKLLAKKNTFTDFIACAQHLVDAGYTAPDRLVAQGGSAGGLLMGAVANARPDLFRAIVAQVPFVDVLRVMLDPSLPLTTGEFVEWGDPRNADYFEYIRSYSPYDNTAPRDYPHLLLTAGIEDDQVPYWQPAKWAARLRAVAANGNLVLLRTNLGAGHSGESGFYQAQRELALVYAFILVVLGLTSRESTVESRQ